MYFVEIIVSTIIILSVSFLWINYLNIEDNNYENYIKGLENQSIKISLYNYVSNITTGQWYISLSWYYFLTWNTWTYYYDCKQQTWYLINTNIPYTGNFCYINYENHKIYNFKLN